MAHQVSGSPLPRPSGLKQYAEAGWGFVPLHKWDEIKKLPPTPKYPQGRTLKLGKAPIGMKWTQHGADLKTALAHANAGKNVGALIPANWAVIDVDPRNFKNEDDSFERIKNDFGLDLSDYAIVKTGSGGWHIFAKLPENWKGVVKHENYPGIELKQLGAQVVAAGSIHPDTQQHYEWMESPVTLAETGPVPQKMLDAYKFERPLIAGSQGVDTWGTLTCEQIEEGLSVVPTDAYRTYDEWFGLMCSVHWLSGGEAREQWIDWSTRDPEYADQAENVAQHWDSLGRGNASAQLVAKGGQFFKALKNHGNITAADERFQIKVDKCFTDLNTSEFEDDAARIKGKQEVQQQVNIQTGDAIVAFMNTKHFILSYKGKTVVGSKKTLESDTGAHVRYEFQDASSFRLFYANRHVPDGSSYADYWLAHPHRLTYDGFEFKPDEPPGTYRQADGALILNQWTGFAIQPDKTGSWELFDYLCREVLCKGDPVKYEYLLNWVAYKYQNLKGPIGTSVVIKGKKGTGKSTFWEVFSRPFGKTHAMSTAKMNEVFGDFNGRMHGKIALCLEEAYFAGSKSAENQMKDLVTGPTIPINEKFLPAYEQDNHSAVVALTNEDWAVPATEDERRYFVLESSDHRKDDHEFWMALRKQMFEDGGCEAFFADMLARPLDEFSPYRDLPRTEELLDQIEITRGAFIDWLAERVQFGEAAFPYCWVSRKGKWIVPKQELWEDFKQWHMNSPRGRYDSTIRSQSQFTRELNRVLPEHKVSTATPPSELIHHVRTYETRVNGKTYQVTNVFQFDDFDVIVNILKNRYGIKAQGIDEDELDEGEDDFDILATDDWDII